jgi:hypothetical protein
VNSKPTGPPAPKLNGISVQWKFGVMLHTPERVSDNNKRICVLILYFIISSG